MSSTVHVVRHGEVENPQKVLYGRQPGWRLSNRGQEMAEVLGEWSKSINLGALHVSPLQRAQETAAPIARAHGITITTDDRLIEAANLFEGKSFEPGSGIWKHPSTWRHLYNPWKPSWGEPYEEQKCTLASVTSIHFDEDGLISGLTYSEPAAHLLPSKK